MQNFSPRSARPSILAVSAAVISFTLCIATPVRAQGPVQRADELLQAGRVLEAESLYYAAASLTPRDPDVRYALGAYLIARGRLRVGATLIEEARFFGGDARRAALALAPVYASIGDFRSLAALPSTPLSASERARVIWLRDNPPSSSGSDSAVVRLRVDSAGGIGRVELRIENETVMAVIDPAVRGLVLDTSWATRPGIRAFPATPGSAQSETPAVALSVQIDDIALERVPVKFAPGVTAAIGLDLLGRLTPTFDAEAEMLIVRRKAPSPDPRGETLATVATPQGLAIPHEGRLRGLSEPSVHEMLARTRWTLFPQRGVLVIDR